MLHHSTGYNARVDYCGGEILEIFYSSVFLFCKVCRVCNDDVEVPSEKVIQIHLFQEPHPLPHPQYCGVKGKYIELLRLQIFHTEKVKGHSDTLIKFGSSRVRIVDHQNLEIHAWCSHVRKLHVVWSYKIRRPVTRDLST